jgi:hypothetical protein
MNSDQLAKMSAVRMDEVFPRLGLTGESAALIQAEPDAALALGRLEQAGYLGEAVKLMAHALPSREAVWWACMCTHHTAPADLPEADRAAVRTAEQWVRQQTDEVRREAFDHAQQAGFGTAESWAAVAAFWSGDSMSPLGQPKVPPAPHLAGTAVTGAISLASIRIHPVRREDRLRRFLASGREIAGGGVGRLEPEEDR